jgi:hypothetical protein
MPRAEDKCDFNISGTFYIFEVDEITQKITDRVNA